MEISYRISWRRDSGGGGDCDADTIANDVLLRGEGQLVCRNGCSGTITSMSYTCTDFSAEENWSFGEHHLAYDFASVPAGTSITLVFEDCCWISPFSSSWNLPSTFTLTKRNDTGRINSTPRAITSPVLRLQAECNHTITLGVSDPDGDIVRCRWAVGSSECGGICNRFPGAELDQDSCTITYFSNRGNGFRAAALIIEDFTPESTQPLSSVALQFLVLVVPSTGPCSQIPIFVPPTIIQNGRCVPIPPHATFETRLTADSGDSSISIVEIQTTSPLGTRKGILQQLNGTNAYYVDITWTPDVTQQNQTHLFCYTAISSGGFASEQICIQLLAGRFPPRPIQESATPNQQPVHPRSTSFKIQFDTDIERPSVASFITFHEFDTDKEVYRIDFSQSQDVSINESQRIVSITPEYTFEEKKKFYIKFERGVVQGLEGCGPGNKPITDKEFWNFETMDLTAPEIFFQKNPPVSNTNVTISWESNEDVVWQCKITYNATENFVNCSEAEWKGYHLSEGTYTLEISATDEANNDATVEHTFAVDLTPPSTTIMQKPLKLSNRETARFIFSCTEICSFNCTLLLNNVAVHDGTCNSGRYMTPVLEHNGVYTFIVTVADEVDNKGESVTYVWETDFKEPQIFGVQNLTIQCPDIDPQYSGRPNTTDDRSESISLVYNDVNLGCSIRRTWSAQDEAGNIAQLTQIISLDYSPTLSLSPQVSFPCDNTASLIQFPTNTAFTSNPCNLPVQLIHFDSISTATCPAEFVRNWTVTVCGKTTSAQQTITLYNVCPFHACGRNETLPRGICSFGECRCNRPWHGMECEVPIYEPSVVQVNDTVLKEAQVFSVSLTLVQGTPPLSWELLAGPDQLRLNQVTGKVTWNRALAGNHTVSVQVTNEVGSNKIELTLYVEPGYAAFLEAFSPTVYPKAQPITLTGHVSYLPGNVIQEFLAGIVQVHIDIVNNGVTRTLKTFTTADGMFSQVFYPAPTEYGSYSAAARHPGVLIVEPQREWSYLGMSAMPSFLSLKGEAISDFEMTFFNATVLCNDGPGILTGLTANANIDATDLDVQIFLRGLPSSETLQPRDKVLMDIKVTSSMPLTRVFPIQLRTTEGTSLQLFALIEVEAILPSLSVNPSSVNARIIRGRSRILEFNITNLGRAEAFNVQALIPDTEILSFISFGSSQQSDNEQPVNLRNGQSATLSILVQTPATQQLGELSASIVITSNEASTFIPIRLTVSSDNLMNLTVVVEDEYTYFASGEPLVDNAAVTIINNQRGIRITIGTKTDNGMATFENIHEDRYEMIVEAPEHRTLTQVIVTSIEMPVVTVFIERQAVTYTWSVTPTTVEDTYILMVEADFETHVPIPVVTVTPTELDLEELELGLVDSVQLNITNHGLIRANGVSIQLPDNHPYLEFSVIGSEVGDLEPLTSITKTVQVTRKNAEKRAVQIRCVLYLINITYSYICGTLQLRAIVVVLRRPEVASVCAVSVKTADVQCTNCDGRFYFNGYSARTPAFCNKCLQSLLGCLPTPDFPLAGCIPLIAAGTGLNSWSDALSWIACILPDGKAKGWLSLFNCIYGVYGNCLSPHISSSSSSDSRRKRSLLSNVNEVLEAMYPIHQSIALGIEVLGDETWLTVGDPLWLSEVLRPLFDDRSELGVMVSNTEFSAILAATPPGETTIEMVSLMVTRLNDTIGAWNNGHLEPDEGFNIASFSAVRNLTQDIRRFNEIAMNKGFTSYLDAYNFARNDINQLGQWEDDAGVCAVVRIRIEQELAVTREAFLAKLEIENQEESPLEQMDLEIIITDQSNGQQSTNLFAIGTDKLSGSLTRVGTTWSLPSEMSGAVEWLIVPYSEAAPKTDHVYNVGGTLRYKLEKENITIPLLPTLITVRPDPSLLVHYFWEKNVIGDDPFTDEVEPSLPFTLGVAVKNAGYGTATSLQITSGQPEIIENEKGLLVNFMIIGASMGKESVMPSLTVMFGNLAPNTTVVARWLMISSLQGEFKNYSATFENINPLGDPKLSILDELDIHELIRNVMIYIDDEDDGILDFLVNERIDVFDYPDALYSSKSLKVYSVSVGSVLSVRYSSNLLSTLEVKTASNITGWVYYRYEDTQDIRFLNKAALSVNTTKLETNNVVDLPPENVWITKVREPGRNTGPDTFHLHILDYVDTTDEVTFTLHLCTNDCPQPEKPFVPPPAVGPLTTPPMFTSTPPPLECGNGSVRLVNSSSTAHGTVEICIDEEWGTICDYLWDNRDAEVVCRQLGFSTEGVYRVDRSTWYCCNGYEIVIQVL